MSLSENYNKFEILNLSSLWELKQEGIIKYQNQTVIQQFFLLKKEIINRNKKTQIYLNKPVYLGLSILELSKW